MHYAEGRVLILSLCTNARAADLYSVVPRWGAPGCTFRAGMHSVWVSKMALLTHAYLVGRAGDR